MTHPDVITDAPRRVSSWTAIRNRLAKLAEDYKAASRYEVASALLDEAARDIDDRFAAPAPGGVPEGWRPSASSDPVAALRQTLEGARDLLSERIYGNPTRSPAHNARLAVESALSILPAPPGEAEKGLGEK